MSDLEIHMVPQNLYYHEVAYVRGLEAAVGEIARQKLTSEMTEDEQEHADYEGAYDTMIRRARAAPATP